MFSDWSAAAASNIAKENFERHLAAVASAAAAAAAAAAAQAAGSTNSGQARSSSSSFLIEDILFPRQKSQQLLEDNNASKATLSSNNGGKFCYIFLMIRDFRHFFVTSSLKSYHFVSIRITYVAPLDNFLKCLEHITLLTLLRILFLGRIGSISYVLPIRQNIDILNRDIRVNTS